jgi:flagellar hook assembly protein FlgD
MNLRSLAVSLAFLALPVCAALLALPGAARAFVEVSNISVRPAAFSPNGDGVNDTTAVSFSTSSEAKSVRIYVDIVDAAEDTVAVLAGGETYSTGSVEFSWDGADTSGAIAAEGVYVFVIVAADEHYTTPPYSASVRLDVTPPRFSALIHPNPYTPDLPMSDSLLAVEIDVSDAKGGDVLTATIGTADPPETLCTFSLTPVDSTYACQWDGRQSPDGVYDLDIKTSDPAGNSMGASYAVDLDVEPPEIDIVSPAESYLDYIPTTYWVTAEDRNGVDSLRVRFYPGTDFLVPEGYPRDECCYAWPESLRIEDEFVFECEALDGVGHWASATRSVVVDTTAPARPVFAPIPSKVGTELLDVEGAGTPGDSVRIYVNDEMQKRGLISPEGTFSFTLVLELGINTLYAVSVDRSGNVSPPSETVTVEYTEDTGISVPEEFTADSRIEINLAKQADRIHIRVLALEGSLLADIVDNSPGLYNEIAWDLKDSGGKQVKNGVYVFAIVVSYADGSSEIEKKAVIVSR